MGGRYWISGVQLGMIKAILQMENKREVFELLTQIEDKQFIGKTKDLKEMIEYLENRKKGKK